MYYGRIFSIILLFAIARGGTINGVLAQETEKTISVKLEDASVLEALQEINRLSGNMVTFRKEEVEKETGKVTLDMQNAKVLDVVKKVLEGTSLSCTETNGRIVVIPKPADLIEVTGRVVDEKGDPIPGASVVVYGTQQGVSTDIDVNVTLNPTSENIEEVQVVAFGTQKKESVVSAITTIRPMNLKSSSSDLTTQLTGKIAGIIGWQTGGLPGALTEEEMNTKFYIRGISSSNGVSEPLVLIDGVESSRLDLARMAPEDIESFSVLKDASATAMYGARGANGVILVTTKKGEEGSVYTSVRYEAVASMPTDKIEVVDPVTYMRMYNQALLARNPEASPAYSIERIERTGNPNYPSFVYPANDWYKILFKNYSINHRAGLSVRGGSNVLQYYASVNYTYDAGMLKTDDLNQFDVNIKNSTISSRINLNVNLNAGIRLLLNTSFNVDKYHGPATDVTAAYAMAFNATPVDFAPTYPGDDTYNWPHIRFGKENEESKNPYLEIQKGYVERTRYSTINRAEYIQNLSSLVKGLELRASVSYSQTGLYASSYSSTPYEYALKEYDFETGKHTLEALNADRADRTLTLLPDYPLTESQMTYELRLLHTAAWGEHQTSITGVAQMQEQTSGGSNQDVLEAMPRRNMTFSMRGTYGYKNRYFAEASFGYNGSERFAEGNRFGFFPSVGAAWVISNEPFMQSVYNWLPYLKLRASWGQVGNDGIIETPRFVFLPDIKTREGAYVDPSPGGGSIQRYYISSYPNDNINPNRSLEIVLTPSLMTDWGLFPRVAGNVVQYHGDLEFRRAELYL